MPPTDPNNAYEDQSAISQDEGRMAFQQLMQDAANPDEPFDAVLTSATNTRALIKSRDKLAQSGIPLISINEPIPDERAQN